VTQTLQLEEVRIIQLEDAPKLLVEWSSRWDEFFTSIGPALSRSGPRLAGEAPHGRFPYKGMLASLLFECFLLFVLMVLPRQIERMRPYAAPRITPDEVIYYSGDELPRTEDLGGSESGSSGRAGGQEAHHRSQTIHVARGGSLASQVVDAPNLKLPASKDAVANLLAFKSANPEPPPAENLRSSHNAPTLAANVVAPPTANVSRDQSRRGLTLNSVVPPSPTISADPSRATPTLNSAIVPPAPSVQSDRAPITPSLDARIIAPAPEVLRDLTGAPKLSASVVAPPSSRISRDRARSTPSLNGSVIPPAPSAAGREVSPSRVQMNNVAVVPPPVSAPESDAGLHAKLNLPAPSVIAPPPSADSSRDMRRLESGAASSSPAIVPPPPTAASNTSFMSSVIGKIFGTQDVVPPPPAVAAATTRNSASGSGNSFAANVIPPPPSAAGTASGAASGTSRRSALGTNIVPPPPSVNASDTNGTSAATTSRRSALGTNVIPPPPSVAGSGSGGAGGTRTGSENGIENALAGNVVPPPPAIGAGLAGSGRKGSGFGGPSDERSVLAPPKGAGGSGDNSGILISAQPGSSVGMPGSANKGSLALSPSGGDKPGLGGSGGGTGIGRGNGPGSGMAGEEGSGAGKIGSGRGTDLDAHNGISPTPGPGGAGTATTGTPAVPGVDVRGGSTIVTLPSFGSDAGSNDPNLPGRTSVKQQQGPAITIVATSRSGGAFDFYGKLPGDNYTVYVDTNIGTAVMQFAEVNPSAHASAGALIGPQGIRSDLPTDLPHERVVIKCRLDASGNLRNLQVLEPGPAAMTAKIMAALPSWKFRPAMRGQQAVEVNAILGFNIDTNDRY
jgi:hypothetical protein